MVNGVFLAALMLLSIEPEANISYSADAATPNYMESSETVFINGRQSDDMEPKSASRARWYAAGATFGPMIIGSMIVADPSASTANPTETVSNLLILGGLIAGPAAGSIYADDWRRAAIGMGIRAGSLLVGTVGVVAVVGGSFGGDESMTSLGIVLLATSMGTIAVSAVYDIFFASTRSVEEYNERRGLASNISIAPWVAPDATGGGHIPETIAKGQLTKTHAKELLPASQLAYTAISIMTLHNFSKFVFRNNFHELTKNSFAGIHKICLIYRLWTQLAWVSYEFKSINFQTVFIILCYNMLQELKFSLTGHY